MFESAGNVLQLGAASAQALWNGLWVGIAVTAIVYALLGALRGLNAATRHAAWYAALIVVAAMPFVSVAASLAHVRITPAPAAAGVAAIIGSDPITPGAPGVAPHAPAAARAPMTASSTVFALVSDVLHSAILERIVAIAAAAVGAVALSGLAALCAGLFGLARAKRASRVVDAAAVPALARTMARDFGARRVDVRISDALDAPAAAGFRTPAILLPAEFIENLDAAALDQIAMHEYAHLRRYDDWTNLVQRVIERLYWFNPAIWYVSSRIDLEREIACDDWAVAGAEGITGYADCLWHLASDGRMPSFAMTAPGAFFSRSQIAARIEHLLERHRDGSPRLRIAKLLAIAPVLALAVAFVVGSAPAIDLRVPSNASTVSAPRTVAIAPSTKPAATPCPVVRPARVHVAGAVHVLLVPHPFTHIEHVIEHVNVERMHVEVRQARAAALAAYVQARAETVAQARAVARARAAAAPEVIASAMVSDNLTLGPADRNLLAHCVGCDLSGKDLRKADLHGLSLTGDDLSGADLRGANLHHAVLTGVDLSDAKLDGADLRGAVLTGSIIDGATFSGAKTEGIHLVGMQLTAAILAVASARDLLDACAGCDLSKLDLSGRDLHGVTLSGTDLSGADLRRANLAGARFNGVDFSKVNFGGADLRNAMFNGCNLSGADLRGAKTAGMRLRGSSSDVTLPDSGG